jgi:hypothetical protein
MRFTAYLAGLWLAALAVPDVLAQPVAPATEQVIVTAPRQRPEDALNHFIIAHAAPTPALGKIGRWKTGICPVTIGLPAKFATFVTQRIIRVAMMAGVPLDSHEPCHPNIAVLATDKPQALLDFVHEKRPALLGFHYRPQAHALATMRLPVQAWYSTATEDFDGFISADMPSGDMGYGVMSTDGADGPARGFSLSSFNVARVSGNRATGNGLQSEFTTAIIVIDTGKIAGQQIGALADYIAMLALSQAPSYDGCQDVPTITNLMATGCADGLKPAGLTDIDATFLRGLYQMDAGRTYLGERASIAYEMKKDLGGY